MKIHLTNFLKHFLFIVILLSLMFVLPLAATGHLRAVIADITGTGSADAVSSASVIIDQPSGNYIVLINTALHTDDDKLSQWEDFFSGREVSYIMEDISCSVMNTDAGAMTMAQSFQSRLSENQMTVQAEDPTMLISRADNGKFDIIIMSREFADAYQAQTAEKDGVEVIAVTGDTT